MTEERDTQPTDLKDIKKENSEKKKEAETTAREEEIAKLFKRFLMLEEELEKPLNPLSSAEQAHEFKKKKFEELREILSECAHLQRGLDKTKGGYHDLVIIRGDYLKLRKDLTAEVKKFEIGKNLMELIVVKLENVKKDAETAVNENFRTKRNIKEAGEKLTKSCDETCSKVQGIVKHIEHAGVRSMAEQAVVETKDFVSEIMNRLRERYEEY